jgi:hypothetical protein
MEVISINVTSKWFNQDLVLAFRSSIIFWIWLQMGSRDKVKLWPSLIITQTESNIYLLVRENKGASFSVSSSLSTSPPSHRQFSVPLCSIPLVCSSFGYREQSRLQWLQLLAYVEPTQNESIILYEWMGSILLCVSNKLNYKGPVWCSSYFYITHRSFMYITLNEWLG